MNSCRIFIFFLLIIISAETYAEGETKNNLHPLLAFGVLESLFAVNAWMASKNPQVYGGIALLLFPVTMYETKNKTINWVRLAAAESLNLYNISLSKEKNTRNEIFKKNMIGWHLLTGALIITDLLNKDENEVKDKKVSVAFVPNRHAANFRLSYRF